MTRDAAAVPLWLGKLFMEWMRLGHGAFPFPSLSFSVTQMGLMVKRGKTWTCQDSGETGEAQTTVVGLPPWQRTRALGLAFHTPSLRQKLTAGSVPGSALGTG